MFISVDDVTKYSRGKYGSDLLTEYFQLAFIGLNRVLCGGLVNQATNSLNRIVEDDCTTVRLGEWFTDVTKVTTSDGNELHYSFNPTVCDITVDGIEQTKYGKILTLKEHVAAGSVVIVSGTYGFTELPESLKAVLSKLMMAYAEHDAGNDSVSSKSIEDVNVSYTHDTSSELVLKRAVTPYMPIIEKWTLCDNAYGIGIIATSPKLTNPPYFIGEGELL